MKRRRLLKPIHTLLCEAKLPHHVCPVSLISDNPTQLPLIPRSLLKKPYRCPRGKWDYILHLQMNNSCQYLNNNNPKTFTLYKQLFLSFFEAARFKSLGQIKMTILS